LEGGGWGEGWVRGGQFTSNLRPRWTEPVTARRVPSKYVEGSLKGNKGGDKEELARGDKSKGNAPCTVYIVIHVYVRNVTECLQ
jgi:hypothetical protein